MTAVDTSVLVGAIQTFDPELRALARHAVKSLYRRREPMVCFPQNLVEFWSVASRPVKAKGLGLTLNQTDQYVDAFLTVMRLLPETPEVFATWQMLVLVHRVGGVHVHDARIVAAMAMNRVGTILSFDRDDFRGYAGITAVHPAEVK
jgi:predicted nucleic acid-binding protein